MQCPQTHRFSDTCNARAARSGSAPFQCTSRQRCPRTKSPGARPKMLGAAGEPGILDRSASLAQISLAPPGRLPGDDSRDVSTGRLTDDAAGARRGFCSGRQPGAHGPCHGSGDRLSQPRFQSRRAGHQPVVTLAPPPGPAPSRLAPSAGAVPFLLVTAGSAGATASNSAWAQPSSWTRRPSRAWPPVARPLDGTWLQPPTHLEIGCHDRPRRDWRIGAASAGMCERVRYAVATAECWSVVVACLLGVADGRGGVPPRRLDPGTWRRPLEPPRRVCCLRAPRGGRGVPDATRSAWQTPWGDARGRPSGRRSPRRSANRIGLEGEVRLCAEFSDVRRAQEMLARAREMATRVELLNVVEEPCSKPGHPAAREGL